MRVNMGVKGTQWNRTKGADEKQKALDKLAAEHAGLLKLAERGDLEAWQQANIVAIRMQSIEDRLRGKANKVYDEFAEIDISMEV
jgi:hypothetical protein